MIKKFKVWFNKYWWAPILTGYITGSIVNIVGRLLGWW